MLVNDLALLLDPYGNSEENKLLICTVIFCLVLTASAKWRVELRAKIGHYRNRCFGDISFQEYVSKGISHPIFFGDLVYKLRRVKDTPNFISSGSKIVKRLQRRQYDPLIIERTKDLGMGPFAA